MSILFPVLVMLLSLLAAAAIAFRARPIFESQPANIPWWQDIGSILTAIAALFTTVFCFLINFKALSTSSQLIITNWSFLLCGAIATFLILRVAGNTRLESDVQKAWQRIGTGCFLWWAGDTILAYYDFTSGGSSTPNVADLSYLPAYGFFFWGVLSFPARFRTSGEARRFWLDSVLIVLGSGLILWYVLPISFEEESLLSRWVGKAYLIGDILLIFSISITILRRVDDRLRWPLIFLASGLLSTVFSDLQSVLLNTASGGWWERIAMVSWLFFSISAHTHWRMSLYHQARVVPPVPSLNILAPFLLVIGAQLILFGALWKSDDHRLSIFILGIVFMITLLLIRQMSTVRENMNLIVEHTTRSGEARFASLIKNSSDAIIVVNSEMTILYTTPSFERILGYENKTALGMKVTEIVRPEEQEKVTTLIHLATTQSSPAAFEILCRRLDGSKVYMEIVATNLLEDPNVHGLVLNLRNIHERKILEEQLIHQAFHDPLTNLANRALFSDRLEHSMRGATRSPRTLAVFLLDLDHFKTINDSFGHATGDAVLSEVALRLMKNVRERDTVARLGGDEFAILLEDIQDVDEACYIAERILGSLRVPLVIEERQLVITASIGIAVGGPGNEDSAELLRNADVSMYVAKDKGRSRFVVFDRNMHAKVQADIDRLELTTQLRKALDLNGFILHYQPIIRLRDGQITGVEALVRWPHPNRGLLLPAEFIPLAENSGLIVGLGNWVLQEACRTAGEWNGKNRPYISINIATAQLHDLSFLTHLDSILNEGLLEPQRIVLEITETSLMSDHKTTLRQLKDLKSLGVRMAIDDFGTGYSSLSYLQNLPVDLIKIDKSFINSSATNLVTRIVELGRSMGFEMIAEGVETPEQARNLQQIDCNFAQGYYFAPPLNAEDLKLFMADESLPFQNTDQRRYLQR